MPTRPRSHHEARTKANVKAYDRWRGSAAERGYDAAWTEYSKAYRKEHPLCARCEEKAVLKPTAVVGHIVPVPPNDPRFMDPTNHTPLCVECNAVQREVDRRRKSICEDGVFTGIGS